MTPRPRTRNKNQREEPTGPLPSVFLQKVRACREAAGPLSAYLSAHRLPLGEGGFKIRHLAGDLVAGLAQLPGPLAV